MPFDCSKISTAGYFNAWKAATSAAITRYQGLGSSTQTENDAMAVLEKDMLDASLCISTSINTLSSISSDVANLNEEILKKSTELSQANEDISIAKDRVANTRHPERNTSNYEGWFPIDRPISVVSLIVIISITIFLGVFLIMLILSFVGVDVILYSKVLAGEPNPYVSAILDQFTLSFWIVLLALISVTIYLVRGR